MIYYCKIVTDWFSTRIRLLGIRIKVSILVQWWLGQQVIIIIAFSRCKRKDNNKQLIIDGILTIPSSEINHSFGYLNINTNFMIWQSKYGQYDNHPWGDNVQSFHSSSSNLYDCDMQEIIATNAAADDTIFQSITCYECFQILQNVVLNGMLKQQPFDKNFMGPTCILPIAWIQQLINRVYHLIIDNKWEFTSQRTPT